MMKNIALFLTLFIIATAIAIGLCPYFFELSLDMVNREGVSITTRSQSSQFGFIYSPVFILSFGLVPIIVFIKARYFKSASVPQLMAAIAIVYSCGVILWLSRILILIAEFEKLQFLTNQFHDGLASEYSIENLHFDSAFAFGILIGMTMSTIYLGVKTVKDSKVITVKR